MRLLLTIYLLIFSCLAVSAGQKQLSSNFPDSVLRTILVPQSQLAPVPGYKDAFWRENIPVSVREDYIAKGESLLNCKWISLPVIRFADYRTTGDRDAYQAIIFGKRNQIMALAMAEIMEGKGRFMPDVINGVFSLCEETWWGVPAHYGPKAPLPSQQSFDLFNAETGGMLAWIYYMFKSEMDAFSPHITQRIEQEIDRRILVPGLTHKDWWRTTAMNWNPWICSNWLACVLFVEKDQSKQILQLKEIFACLDRFIDGYPEDGGCDEGPAYWDRATGSLIDCLWLLGRATNNKIDLSDNPKIHAMGSFLSKMNIGHNYCVNFADAGPRLIPNIDCVFPAGVYLKDDVLCSYAADIAKQIGYFNKPTAHKTYLFSLNRELTMLSMVDKFQNQQGVTKLYFDTYLPRIEVTTGRSKENSTDGIYFAAKGGHNAESHNHNDVGSYILYADAQPLIIDPGVGTYRRETFNDATRYGIWTMQSGYHNLPKINGVDQQNGRRYAAKSVTHRANSKQVDFSLDIASAYPDKAQVKSWRRTFKFVRGKHLEVSEDYSLGKHVSSTEIMLMTPCQPTIKNGQVVLDCKSANYAILFDPTQLEASYEKVDMQDEKMTATWGDLYRVKLKIRNSDLQGKVSYRISKI